ncbi:MAG: hypothetical protein LUO91_06830 [Methanomicrobiales archaeon]|nr:hypothetical protein [Methanomicrobiales archaeon]
MVPVEQVDAQVPAKQVAVDTATDPEQHASPVQVNPVTPSPTAQPGPVYLLPVEQF